MRVSVVINTYNRGTSLRNTLAALRYQTHADFEVVVVNGPSTDDTDTIIAEYEGMVRPYRCPERHLSKSRNIGVAQAAGDVVAFIDDDAVPEPGWLADLVAAYDAPDVGGAGGIVYDHTGAGVEYDRAAVTRLGRPVYDLDPDDGPYCRPGADPFLNLLGTNCSFRRDVLVEIGGFNEEIVYYLDESEVCLRVIDAGYELRAVRRAAVHHKCLPGPVRGAGRVILDPYHLVRSQAAFATRYGLRTRPATDVLADVAAFAARMKAEAEGGAGENGLTADALEAYRRRVDAAVEDGVRIGLSQPRPFRHLPPPRPERFRPYPTLTPAGGRLKLCFVSQGYGPGRDGISRFTTDLARGAAAAGHEVHVVTRSAAGRSVDFEAGVWVHRLPAADPPPQTAAVILGRDYAHAAGVYHEVARVHAACGGLDLVSAPIWMCEGAVCQLDDRWPTLLTLQTTMKTVAGMAGTTGDPAYVRGLIALEAATAKRAAFVCASSRASLARVRSEVGGLCGETFVVPHGTEDAAARHPHRATDGRVRILFVGRIEARKGVDVLLEAAYRVLPEFPSADLVLVGADNPTGGATCLDRLRQVMAEDPGLRSRITLAGEVDEESLWRHYAECDVFVLPSRYESFGLVLTEAMAFGKPVIASRAGGMAEVVADGETGLLVEPGDAESLAAALRRLLADPGLRERFGRAGRARFEEQFSVRAMVEGALAAYRRAVAAHRPARDPGDVAGRLAGLIAETSGVSAATAGLMAGELLSPDSFDPARDYPAGLAALWPAGDEEFVRGVYVLLYRRPADGLGFRHFTTALRAGLPRLEVVRHLLESDEAKARQVPGGWLAGFVPPAPPPAVRRPGRSLLGLAARAARAALRYARSGPARVPTAPTPVPAEPVVRAPGRDRRPGVAAPKRPGRAAA